MDLFISSYLPQLMALTMELNLSSKMTMSEALCATLVPVIPMAKPTKQQQWKTRN